MSESTPAYGVPAKKEVILNEGFSAGTGLVYEVHIYRDNADLTLKDKSGKPQVFASDFFSSLVNAVDDRWFFSGVLNGWDGLTTLELLEIRDRGNKRKAQVFWPELAEPHFPSSVQEGFVVAMLRRPDYTGSGYTRGNKGFLWWAEASRDGTVDGFHFGEAALEHAKSVSDKLAQATMVHHWGHRWGRKGKRETLAQRIEYHTGVLIEWDHGRYVSLVEKTWLNGMGGAKGHSQWLSDTFQDSTPSLFKSMAPTMRVPFSTYMGEIRLFDLPFKTLTEFKAFMKQHTGLDNRMLGPEVRQSSKVKRKLTKQTLVSALLNYTRNHAEFKWASPIDAGSNCQTLSSDLLGFLTKKRKAVPFTTIAFPVYTPHQEWFQEPARA